MKEHHGPAVGRPDRRHIHIRDPDVLPIQIEVQEVHGMGILDLLLVDGDRPPVGRRFGRWLIPLRPQLDACEAKHEQADRRDGKEVAK